jgi:hypothetical protein
MASQIRCGPRVTPLGEQFTMKTVAAIRRELSRSLDIPEGSPAVVSRDNGGNPVPVREDYTLQNGDLLEFVRPQGTKGTFEVLASVRG